MLKNNTLFRKLLRDISREKLRFIAVTLLIFMGVAVFSMAWMASKGLRDSYARTSELLNYNDFLIQVGEAPDSIMGELEKIDGVKTVMGRFVKESGGKMPGGEVIKLKLVGVPVDSPPDINKLYMETGKYLNGQGLECIAESHLEDFYKLKTGSKIKVETPAGAAELEVRGSAASAEYFFIYGGGMEFMASPRNYGVLFVPMGWLQDSYGKSGVYNEFCFLVDNPADAGEVMGEAKKVLAPYNISFAETGAEHPTRKLLNLDMETIKEVSTTFPLLFLLVAAMSLYMILTRMVNAQKSQIGTMMACGKSGSSIMLHYGSYALLVATIGSVSGAVAGYFLAGVMCDMYAAGLGIPLVSASMDWGMSIMGVIVALVFAVLASIIPVGRFLRKMPAQVISDRDGGYTHRSRRTILEHLIPPLRKMSVMRMMPMRNLSRNRRRSFSTIVGIVFVLALTLTAFSFLDSMNSALGFEFNEFVKYEAEVLFTEPLTPGKAREVCGIKGVDRVEPETLIPARFSDESGFLGEGVVDCLPSDTKLLGLYDSDGNAAKLPDDSVLLCDYFADELGVEKGDTIKASTTLGEIDLKVGGFIKQLGGFTAYMSYGYVIELFGYNNFSSFSGMATATGALISSETLSVEDLRTGLSKVPEVASVSIPEYTEETIQTQYMSMIYIFAIVMIISAIMMGVAIIYNTVSIEFLERRREISTMLAMGSREHYLTTMLTIEHLALTIAAIPFGLLAGVWLADYIMQFTNNEFFIMPAVINPLSFVLGIVFIIALVLIVQLPDFRRIRRMDVVAAIRERTG